jgi:hypothetical protein
MAAVVLSTAGCSTFDVLSFQPDKELSGRTENERVYVEYVHPEMDPASLRKTGAEEYSSHVWGDNVPEAFEGICGQDGIPEAVARPKGVLPPAAVAVGTVAFDAVLGAIDSRREQLIKAAEHAYSDTLIVRSLRLAPPSEQSSEDQAPSSQQKLGDSTEKFTTVGCILIMRRIKQQSAKQDQLAMQALFAIQRVAIEFSDDKDKKTNEDEESNEDEAEADEKDKTVDVGGWALTITPAYLDLELAGAQTQAVEEGKTDKPKIALSGSVGIVAVEDDDRTGRRSVKVLTNSPFSFGTVEIESTVANPRFVNVETLKKNGWKSMRDVPGPLFRPQHQEDTVGAIAVSVTEVGAASTLDEPSAAEKSIRATTRALIGTAIETRFAE